jgi:NTE family protein
MDARTGRPQGRVALALGGGAALGAYHLGVIEALAARGIEPEWIVGVSIGAVTAAIWAGAPPEERLPRLREFWATAAQTDWPGLKVADTRPGQDGDAQALRALLWGRPGVFAPRYPGLWSLLPLTPRDVALRDHAPLGRTLARLVDFDRLRAGAPRIAFAALDVESGEEAWFDSRTDRIGPRHLLAATALLPLFPPVELDGRLLCDAGLANNLPLDRVFEEPCEGRRLCIASDLFPLARERPTTLSGAAARAQELGFASQTRRAVARLRRDEGDRAAEDGGATLALLAYRGEPRQSAGKGLDFSAGAIATRIAAGRADAARMLERLAAAPTDRRFVVLPPEGPAAAGETPTAATAAE